jgi:hypothetical protein
MFEFENLKFLISYVMCQKSVGAAVKPDICQNLVVSYSNIFFHILYTSRRSHLQNRKSQCLANPNVQPDFSYEKYG